MSTVNSQDVNSQNINSQNVNFAKLEHIKQPLYLWLITKLTPNDILQFPFYSDSVVMAAINVQSDCIKYLTLKFQNCGTDFFSLVLAIYTVILRTNLTG